VTLIDYGMGNLGSLRRSLEECGAEVSVSADPRSLETAERIILPGVGAFADGMRHLTDHGWIPAIHAAVMQRRTPWLGICLGMQLMATRGTEGGDTLGLGLIPGDVKRLDAEASKTRIPHIGWNEVHAEAADSLLSGIRDLTDFYFVHSYHFEPERPETLAATTPYCGRFASMVRDCNLSGVQFHPEKSQKPGLRLLQNFLKMDATAYA
jgi:imidazole glycerol-phosphate synthase subunit HisH